MSYLKKGGKEKLTEILQSSARFYFSCRFGYITQNGTKLIETMLAWSTASKLPVIKISYWLSCRAEQKTMSFIQKNQNKPKKIN